MTNEKMLEIMLSIKSDMDYCVCYPGSTIAIVPDAIKQLQEDIRHDCQKKKGNVKRDTLVKKLWKTVQDWKPIYMHYVEVGDKFGFLDGYRAYVLNDPLGYPKQEGEQFKLGSLRPKEKGVAVHVDLADVQAFIKLEKAAGRTGARGKKLARPYVLDAGSFKVGFTPAYLVEFCQMFGTDTIWCGSPLSPAYYEADNGEWGLLLPVRMTKQEA